MELKIGSVIKRFRSERGLTQEELANKIGVSFQAVSKWETNATTPDISLLPRLAVIFGCTIDDLFALKDDDYVERIQKMIRDDYSISPENFTWAERYLKGKLAENKCDHTSRILLIELYESRTNRDQLMQGKLAEEGILIDPTAETLHKKLLAVRKSRNETDRLIRFYEALSADSNQALVFDMLAELYIENGMLDQAENIVHRSLPHAKGDILTGDIDLARGKTASAKSKWLKIAEEYMESPGVLFEIAERFEKIREYDSAIKLYQKAHDCSAVPKILDPIYSLAFLYERIGKPNDAVRMWEQIIECLKRDYGITSGESVDWPKREIQRLKKV